MASAMGAKARERWSGKAVGTLSFGAGLGGAALIAPAVAGFTAEGVAAGSVAAAWQSSIGGSVAAGSNFAALQSFGATMTVAPAAGAGLLMEYGHACPVADKQ
ncbi:hypothetical protein T484DRAFT_1867412 [Baffinella frigidus]|nr:hypothetical protein T484DRAFT_1867412 [Cryptophyta sp. CCMP2293]